MRLARLLCLGSLGIAVGLTSGCHSKISPNGSVTSQAQPTINYFKLDPAHAGSIKGTIHFSGKRPARKLIDMSEDPACVEAHQGKAYDESLVLTSSGAVANAFVYIEKGLEGKTFQVPATPIVIDQKGCWFRPRVMGIQTGQVLQVVNSDPVTHNIHPMPMLNREWNHSQGPGDPPISRKFLKPEVMIRVKCNIHSWMHEYIGVLDHPYYAVSNDDGSFTLANLPPGTYTLAVWQEKLGTQEQQITVTEGQDSMANVSFKGQ